MWELLLTIIKDFAFPKQCFGCSSWGNFVCKKCKLVLMLTQSQRCLVCSQSSLNGWTHPKCRGHLAPDRLISIFDYHNKLVSQLIISGKNSFVPDIFMELSEIAVEYLEIQNPKFYSFVLCPIPLTKHKKRWRGFNQSQIISQVFSRHFTLALDQVVKKIKMTKEQKLLNKIQRADNLKNSFEFTGGSVPKYVILIDDVTTTGATFLEATRVLKKAGVKSVWCLALAQD